MLNLDKGKADENQWRKTRGAKVWASHYASQLPKDLGCSQSSMSTIHHPLSVKAGVIFIEKEVTLDWGLLTWLTIS